MTTGITEDNDGAEMTPAQRKASDAQAEKERKAAEVQAEKERKAAEAQAEKERKEAEAVRRASLAFRGTLINPENAPSFNNNYDWPQASYEDLYLPAEIDDFTDLNVATRELLRLRILLHKARQQLDAARREEAQALAEQKAEYNRIFILTSGATETLRKTYAEIKNENAMTRLIVAQAVAKEKMELSRTIGKEIEAWKTICDNIRKQMSI